MTLKELTTTIAESSNSDWYLKRQILLHFPHINYKRDIVGVPAFYEYLLKQIAGFNKETTLPRELIEVKKRFEDAKKTVLVLIKNGNVDDYGWNNNFEFLKNNSPLLFPSDAPETEFLIRINQERPENYPGAYEYMSGRLIHTEDRKYWIGYMLAYEFMSKDFSAIVARKEAEKKSIASTRADFQSKLGEAETHLTEYLGKANQKFVEYSAQIDELKTTHDLEYTTWYRKAIAEFNNFKGNADKQVKELETLYRDKLKLEAPAKYWSDRAKKLRGEGRRWLIGLVTSVVVGLALLIWCLSAISAGTLDGIFRNNGTAIKWSVVFITLISFLAYAIRIFSKLTFSSFHLVRDAEEREQLTYVYLALQKEKGIDQTERHLIMQSLFSRADSGLLKDDASPTMPGNIVDQMTKR